MNKLPALILLSAAVMLASLSARAADLQIEYLMLEADLEDVDEFEPDAIQLKYVNPVNPGIDVMGVFAFGISDDEIEETDPFFGTVSLSVELSSLFGIYGRARAELGDNARVYGQLGLVQIKFDLDAEIFGLTGSESYDETGVAFGVGIAIDVSDRASIVIEYNQFPDVDVEDLDLESTGISLGYRAAF